MLSYKRRCQYFTLMCIAETGYVTSNLEVGYGLVAMNIL